MEVEGWGEEPFIGREDFSAESIKRSLKACFAFHVPYIPAASH